MQRKGSPRFSDRLSAHLGELEAAAAEEEAAPSRRRYSMRLTSHLLEKAQGEANGDGGAPHHALASRTSFEDELLAEASTRARGRRDEEARTTASSARSRRRWTSLIGGEGSHLAPAVFARGKTRRIVAGPAPAAAAAEAALRLTLASPDGNRRRACGV